MMPLDPPVVVGATAAPPTPRQSESPYRLLMAAIGGPREIAGKFRRAARTARLYIDRAETQRRIDRLQTHLALRAMPSRRQMWFGGLDMLRFLIVPAARDYYRSRGIDFRFHQLLRFLDDPASLTDPVGFLSDQDVIIGHLMQVVHLNPRYDVQLLGIFPDGVAELERQLVAMIDGTHPRAASIGAIVEHPDYHAALLAYVRGYQRNPRSVSMMRAQGALRGEPAFALAEAQFSALDDFLRYAIRLPRTWSGLLRHRLGTRTLDPALCDRAPPAVLGARSVHRP